MIHIEGLNKYYNRNLENELHVLKDLNFSLDLGRYVAIMGKSGVGKTTLLNNIGGLESFDSGSYTFMGKEMKKIAQKDLYRIVGKEITFVFQEYLLIEEDSVLENIRVPLYFDRKADFIEKVHAAMQAAGLSPDLMHKKCAQLSGGQKQRVAIARAIVNSPKLILADEPTGSLDYHSSCEILELFSSLVTEERSVILVTHDREVAVQTEQIFEMVDGKLHS